MPNPPPFRPEFSLKVVFAIATLPLSSLTIAPPQPSALFFENVLPVTLRPPVPPVAIAPPRAAAAFSVKVESTTVRWPSLVLL